MLERITFKNHINETLEFGDGEGIFLNYNELHSYKWNYVSKNNKISYFNRNVQEKKIPIVVICNSRNAGYQTMNKLMELADKDIIANIPGKIIVGDYYLECFIFASEKERYDLGRGAFYTTLTSVTDKPMWVKEITRTFHDGGDPGSEGDLDFPFDFPYDFTSPNSVKELENTSFADTDFKLVIYGEVTNPSIIIGAHEYSLSGHIGANEYVIVDSRDKTVTLVQSNGTRVNWFSHRDRESYIFEKIPSGTSNVLWLGDYYFDIVLFDARSEPVWYPYESGGDEPYTIEPFTAEQMASLFAIFDN